MQAAAHKVSKNVAVVVKSPEEDAVNECIITADVRKQVTLLSQRDASAQEQEQKHVLFSWAGKKKKKKEKGH